MPSLSRQLSAWICDLRYDDLAPEVVDRVKGLTLHFMASALLGSQKPAGQQAVKMIVDEELGVRKGATILVDGSRVTPGGAAFANAELGFAGGKWDTFRMLLHPGISIIPTALVAAEVAGASGQDFLAAVAAGYEVSERMAADFIPTLMARGFHPGPVFGLFGAAIAAGKILGLNAEQMNSTIALCVSLAGSNPEGARSGGKGLREGAAVRNAMLAVTLARNGHAGGETTLEGEAGFYHAFAGNNLGRLSYSFVGDTQASLDKITRDLGKDWMLLETLYKIHSMAGYNIAHIDVTAALCVEHDIRPENVDRIEAVVNWLETQYPSPAFPATREDAQPPRPGMTPFFTAYAVVNRGFPLLLTWSMTGGAPGAAEVSPAVLDLMQRTTLIPSHTMTLFGPRITIHMKDGSVHTRQGTGREFIWDFEEQVRRIRGVAPAIPIPPAQWDDIIATCRELDRQARADKLVQLTLKQAHGPALSSSGDTR